MPNNLMSTNNCTLPSMPWFIVNSYDSFEKTGALSLISTMDIVRFKSAIVCPSSALKSNYKNNKTVSMIIRNTFHKQIKSNTTHDSKIKPKLFQKKFWTCKFVQINY